MTNHACGFAVGFRDEETFTTGAGWRVSKSGSGALTDGLFPFAGGVAARGVGVLERRLGFNGAPHSSQYCEPSRFSVLHLSQVIIVLQDGLIVGPASNRYRRGGKLWILARNHGRDN
jgi:hypothetical protein